MSSIGFRRKKRRVVEFQVKILSAAWRYAQVAKSANRRLIDTLAIATLTGTATEVLDSLCQLQTVVGNRIA